MISKNRFLLLVSLTFLTFTWISCSTSKTTGTKTEVDSYVGKWKYEAPDMPDDNTGVLVISKNDEGYSCMALTDGGNEQAINIEIVDGKLTGYWEDGMGTRVDMTGLFNGKELSGSLTVDAYEISYKAEKVE